MKMNQIKKKIPIYVLDENKVDMPKSILDLEFELSRGTYESTKYIDGKPIVIIVENENTKSIFKRKKEE